MLFRSIVDPTADSDIESDETVSLSLAPRLDYINLTTTPVTGTITNDDPRISLAVSPGLIPEDSQSKLIYTFTRTGVSTSALTVNYSVAGSATLGSDYSIDDLTGTTHTVTFESGSSTATVTVTPKQDSDIEPNETVLISLLPGSDYFFVPGQTAVGTILNDDPKGYAPGASSIAGVNLGRTSLGYALRVADAEPIQVVYPYGYASADNPGNGWSAVAAIPTANGFALYWRTNNNGPTARWDLDAHGVYTSGFLLSAQQLNHEEASVNLDLNGDGYIAGPRSIAGVNLGSTSMGYALRNGGATPLQVSYFGLNAAANNPGDGWIACAASTSNSGYGLYWRNSNTGQTVRWQLNSSGAYTSGSVLSLDQVIREEAKLNTDLNDDGIIGVRLGSSAAAELVLNTGPSVNPVTDADGHAATIQRGDGWNALSVAASESGYALDWGHDTNHQVERWTLNSSGAFTSSVTLTSSEIVRDETQFNLDLNGDG